MSWEPLLCANGGHGFPIGESVLMHNTAADGEPARFVCHPCWCFGLEGHAETRRASVGIDGASYGTDTMDAELKAASAGNRGLTIPTS